MRKSRKGLNVAKSYNWLFRHMLLDESLDNAFLGASEGKRDRNDVKEILSNLPYHKKRLKRLIENDEVEFPEHRPCEITEANCHKKREIIKPFYKYEQVIHHLIVNEIKDIVMHGFYEYSCGSIPGRGCHYGKKHVSRWIDSYPKGAKLYVLKMDIRHFFENVDHDILKEKLSKVIRDKKFLRLMFKVIDSVSKGLPLGYYTSQWFANFFLKDLDHYIKEVLEADEFIRYMDDMVVFGTDKDKLHRIREGIEKYLETEKLELKGNWQIFPLAHDKDDRSGRPLDFMGFKFYRNNTTLRKSILCRARRKAIRISRKDDATWYDATGMISYMGWFDHTDTYGYFIRNIKPLVIISRLKWKVAKHQRKENIRNDRLEKSKRKPSFRAFGYRPLYVKDYGIPA